MINEIKTRGPKPKDIPFIYSTWLDSYRHDSHLSKDIRTGIFYSHYQIIIDRLLETSEVLLAVSKEDEDVIFGYIVCIATESEKTIHYMFVKHAFREYGISKLLFNHFFNDTIPITITHKTKYINPILDNKRFLIFNPFSLYKGV